MARCPAHDDNRPSLSIDLGDEGLVFKCFAGCRNDMICRAAGFDMKMLFWHQWEKSQGKPMVKKVERKIVGRYEYTDEEGKVLFACYRYEPKSFSFQRPIAAGQWISDLTGVRMVPYGLKRIVADNSRAVYIVEGERKANRLVDDYLCATCNPGGTGMGWRKSYSELLAGRSCVILPDNDEPGWKHAYSVAGMLLGYASQIKIVGLPGLKEKEDVLDWLKTNSVNELIDVVCQADSYCRVPGFVCKAA